MDSKDFFTKWRLVQRGSRFLSDAETRYAVVELDLVGVGHEEVLVVYAWPPYFELVVDHKLDTIDSLPCPRWCADTRTHRGRV